MCENKNFMNYEKQAGFILTQFNTDDARPASRQFLEGLTGSIKISADAGCRDLITECHDKNISPERH